MIGDITLNAQNHKAIIKLDMCSRKFANTLFQALIPETNIPQKSETKIQIIAEDSILILRFEAKNTSRLRAIINSYLRWVITAIETIDAIEELF